MATRSKTGTFETLGKKVKKATKAAVKAADDYVVEPVSKALGLTGKKTRRKTTAAKTTPKRRSSRTTAKARSK